MSTENEGSGTEGAGTEGQQVPPSVPPAPSVLCTRPSLPQLTHLHEALPDPHARLTTGRPR
ncbi:hypothetical protein, partial [Streptomyces albidoflavus]|uniref:hypothetical protein n=1 Tax=Streptomyces albidoflavus TaxID=1886 RepID=UPI00117C3795